MWNDRFQNPCSLYVRGVSFDPVTATVLTMAGAGLSAGSTIMGGNAAAKAGEAGAAATQQAAQANANSLEFQAAQDDQSSNEARAASQRDALEKGRATTLALSTLQARAAAGGGGASDQTVTDIAGQIAQRGEYQALSDLYTGDNRAAGFSDKAKGERLSAQAGLQGGALQANAMIAEGSAKQDASYVSAAGTIAGGAGSAYRTYKGISPTRYG